MSVKLDVYGLLYHNITLKYVTKVSILNRMYRESPKNRKCCDNIVRNYANKEVYTDNGLHENIDPKFQNISKTRY